MKKKSYEKPLTEVIECETVLPLQASGNAEGKLGMQDYFENPLLDW